MPIDVMADFSEFIGIQVWITLEVFDDFLRRCHFSLKSRLDFDSVGLDLRLESLSVRI